MNIQHTPNTIEKLTLLGDVNPHERVGDQPQHENRALSSRIAQDIKHVLSCISMVSTPKGKKPVLKTMVTTACEKGCNYCPFRAGRRGMHRVTFKPDELAQAFDQIQRARLVDGIFLSSGVAWGGVTTQDKIIDTIEIIRRKYGYTGYVHLKLMPGAEFEQVRRAMQLADRVSVNLEGPTKERLDALAPGKDFSSELLERLLWTHQIRQQADPGSPERVRAGTVTQFVVGAVGDTDLELLSLTERLYQQIKLRRAYYSAFGPIEETPFENLPHTPPLREFRLYQSSFLLRDYEWDVEELPFQDGGNLPLDVDPKRAWADEHLRESPIDVMHAGRRELMRIPGVGPKGANAIIKARRAGHLTELGHLRAIGIRAPQQAASYILLDGRRPPQQLAFDI
ncbi:MAG: radical SAM protein [Anaerolineae bacterium]|nr:radical SAM protein [Anaerolineae bacterium]